MFILLTEKAFNSHETILFFTRKTLRRMVEDAKYIQPDAANFNSWRRHIKLLGDPPDEVVFAWEDVKVGIFLLGKIQG